MSIRKNIIQVALIYAVILGLVWGSASPLDSASTCEDSNKQQVKPPLTTEGVSYDSQSLSQNTNIHLTDSTTSQEQKKNIQCAYIAEIARYLVYIENKHNKMSEEESTSNKEEPITTPTVSIEWINTSDTQCSKLYADYIKILGQKSTKSLEYIQMQIRQIQALNTEKETNISQLQTTELIYMLSRLIKNSIYTETHDQSLISDLKSTVKLYIAENNLIDIYKDKDFNVWSASLDKTETDIDTTTEISCTDTQIHKQNLRLLMKCIVTGYAQFELYANLYPYQKSIKYSMSYDTLTVIVNEESIDSFSNWIEAVKDKKRVKTLIIVYDWVPKEYTTPATELDQTPLNYLRNLFKLITADRLILCDSFSSFITKPFDITLYSMSKPSLAIKSQLQNNISDLIPAQFIRVHCITNKNSLIVSILKELDLSEVTTLLLQNDTLLNKDLFITIHKYNIKELVLSGDISGLADLSSFTNECMNVELKFDKSIEINTETLPIAIALINQLYPKKAEINKVLYTDTLFNTANTLLTSIESSADENPNLSIQLSNTSKLPSEDQAEFVSTDYPKHSMPLKMIVYTDPTAIDAKKAGVNIYTYMCKHIIHKITKMKISFKNKTELTALQEHTPDTTQLPWIQQSLGAIELGGIDNLQINYLYNIQKSASQTPAENTESESTNKCASETPQLQPQPTDTSNSTA
ncbi:hypothetical protein NEOKW01_2120 [Nematocida sp. AWRm80]|nr:hypothetical protein NEOKW01_2120 [Nematocida sp. AWRm80]